jgi:hypothetical protein
MNGNLQSSHEKMKVHWGLFTCIILLESRYVEFSPRRTSPFLNLMASFMEMLGLCDSRAVWISKTKYL